MRVLAKRNGIDKDIAGQDMEAALAAFDDEALSSFTAGTMFVLCGGALAESESFVNLSTMLKLKPEQIVQADESGVIATDDETQVSRALDDLEHFLSTHRHSDDHLDKQGLLLDDVTALTLENLENRAAIKDAISDQSAQQIAGRISNLFKIVNTQLQQTFSFLTWDWDWPKSLIAVKAWVGSWVLFDFPTLLNIDCLTHGLVEGTYGGARYGGATKFLGLHWNPEAVMGLAFLALLACVGCVSLYNRRKYRESGDQAAGARASHMSNFAWALFTLVGPAALGGLFSVFDSSASSAGDDPIQQWLIIPPVLIIPLVATRELRKAQAAGTLHSRAFEARYGWLCSRCVATRPHVSSSVTGI